MAHIILSPINPETPFTLFYVVNDSAIETIKCNAECDQYGQEAGADNAGDYLVLLSEKSVRFANALSADWESDVQGIEEFETENEVPATYKVKDYISAHDNYKLFCDILDLLSEEDYDLNEDTFQGISYYDGHNFRTISVDPNYPGQEYEIVEDENLISKIEEAIENAEWDAEHGGYQCGRYENIEITVSRWQGSWEKYLVEVKN